MQRAGKLSMSNYLTKKATSQTDPGGRIFFLVEHEDLIWVLAHTVFHEPHSIKMLEDILLMGEKTSEKLSQSSTCIESSFCNLRYPICVHSIKLLKLFLKYLIYSESNSYLSTISISHTVNWFCQNLQNDLVELSETIGGTGDLLGKQMRMR